jgi:hypothetical protein
VVSFPKVSPPKPCICLSSTPDALDALLISFSWFYHLNNIGWRVHITKVLIMSFSPLPCYLVPLRPKFSPQNPVLKYTQPMFLP